MTVNKEKTTDLHSNKCVETESECTDNLSDDSCGGDEKIAGL